LFEGLSNGRSKEFPERFLMAVKVGADLSCVGWKFLHWLLTEELASRDDPRVANQIKRCADVLVPLTKGEPCDKGEAKNANADAYAYAANAADTADAAADAAANAAADAADAAADDADDHTDHAAAAAAHAPDAADAHDADTANAAAAYADAARSKCYERMAEK